MSQPTRGRGRGRGKRGGGGGGGERENWSDKEKEIIKDILGPNTEYYNKIHGDATSLQKYEVWQKICEDFCAASGRPQVNHQKLRDMYKKEMVKVAKQHRREHTMLVAQEREYQLYSKGTGGGPAAPVPQHHDPDVHGLQQFSYPLRIPTSFNTLTVQQRMVHPSTITSESDHPSQYIFPSSTATATATATASSSLSAPAVGPSTGVSPIHTGVPGVDHTDTEFANTGGTTENVEDLDSRMENQHYREYYGSSYEHNCGQIPPDDFGVSVAIALTQNRTSENRLPLTTLTEEEHIQQVMDTTQLESATTSAPDLLLTPSTNVSTTPGQSGPAPLITRDALTHALNMAERTLQPRGRVPVTAPAPGVQPRQEARSRQQSGGNADRGRRRIQAARGDVASAAEKYYKDMLEIQRQSGAKYVEYINAKIANEKAMHEKEMQIKDAQLQLLRKQLETGGTPRTSTPVRRPRWSAVFQSPQEAEEAEQEEENQEPTIS